MDNNDRKDSAEFPYSKMVVFRALLEAIPMISGMKIERVDEQLANLDVSVGLSASSWGENVYASVRATSKNSSVVAVRSVAKSRLGSAGEKNGRNVSSIISTISIILRRDGARWSLVLDDVHSVPLVSFSDELSKLAKLRSDGILTAAEFEAAKKRLLAR